MSNTIFISKFKKTFPNYQSLENKFDRFSPLVIRYMDALCNLIDDVSPTIIDSLKNSKGVKQKSGEKINFSVRGHECENFNLRGGAIYKTIHMFTREKSYNENILNALYPDFSKQMALLEKTDLSNTEQSVEQKQEESLNAI